MLDIGFTKFITNTWVSIIWVLMIVVHGFVALAALGTAFVQDPMLGMVALIGVPLIACFSLLLCRIWLELVIVIFRIESNTRALKDKNNG